MTTNPYNGWTGPQRGKAGAWLKRQYASGALRKHDECCVCLRPGQFAGHAEDYSEPFGPHVNEYGLCFSCHMAVHCRFRNLDAWQRYKEQMATGYQYPDVRDFRVWIEMFTGDVPPRMVLANTPRNVTWLDTLADTREGADARWAHKALAGQPDPPDSLF